MKTQIISLMMFVLIANGCSSKNELEPNEVLVENNSSMENNSTEPMVIETNTTIEEVVSDVNTSSARTYSKFEKTFINHSAYNHYKRAIDFMYANDHKNAYNEAISAKDIYDNTKIGGDIQLPYIPGYVRENAQTPRRIYYKIVEDHNYELKRLIRKIKLLNPPIPLITYIQTSTYIDITVQNVGDIPLDKFVIEINYEKIKEFDKINPNQSLTYRYNSSSKIDSLSFTEEYGFAPEPIELIEE